MDYCIYGSVAPPLGISTVSIDPKFQYSRPSLLILFQGVFGLLKHVHVDDSNNKANEFIIL